MDAGAKFVMLAPVPPLAGIAVVFARPPWTPFRILGLVLFIGAFALLTVARWQLGNSFSITPQARALVTRGIYSKVRHPVYVFGALTLCGIALYMPLPWLFLALILVVPLQIMRARAEEKILIAKFGDSYMKYKKSTWI